MIPYEYVRFEAFFIPILTYPFHALHKKLSLLQISNLIITVIETVRHPIKFLKHTPISLLKRCVFIFSDCILTVNLSSLF
jgi:hypothetical protein